MNILRLISSITLLFTLLMVLVACGNSSVTPTILPEQETVLESEDEFVLTTTSLTNQTKVLMPTATAGDQLIEVVAYGNRVVVGEIGPGGDVNVFKQRANGLKHKDTITSTRNSHGAALGLYGNRLLVGAPYDTVNGQSGAGSAIIYERKNGQWQQKAVLTDDVVEQGEQFGTSTSIYQRWAAVGIPFKREANNNHPGGAAVFKRVAGQWQQQAIIMNPDSPNQSAHYDAFGASVSIEGNILVVGAPLRDRTSYNIDEGIVHVYKRQGNTWNLVQSLDPTAAFATDRFGWSTLVKDGRIYVGAVGRALSNNSSARTGAVYIYEQTNGPNGPTEQWSISQIVEPSQSSAGFFGHAISVDDDKLLVGANITSDTAQAQGAAYLYELQNGVWQETHVSTTPTPSTYDKFGTSVAISNGYSYVVAPGDDEAATDAGALFVHE